MFAVALLALIVVEDASKAYIAPAPTWFSIKNDAAFKNARESLQLLVDSDARHAENRFCVVGAAAGRYRSAYVHWPQENKLILWEPRRTPDALIYSRRNLDLKDDVVEGDDVGGSTYLLTRAEANEIIDACRRLGTRFVISRKKPVGKAR